MSRGQPINIPDDACSSESTSVARHDPPEAMERRGWRVMADETIAIAGVPFVRYRMDKSLRQS